MDIHPSITLANCKHRRQAFSSLACAVAAKAALSIPCFRLLHYMWPYPCGDNSRVYCVEIPCVAGVTSSRRL